MDKETAIEDIKVLAGIIGREYHKMSLTVEEKSYLCLLANELKDYDRNFDSLPRECFFQIHDWLESYDLGYAHVGWLLANLSFSPLQKLSEWFYLNDSKNLHLLLKSGLVIEKKGFYQLSTEAKEKVDSIIAKYKDK